ncbi:MAG: hypothetical protein ACOYMG_05585, partial [Candidatus Methylumidiphilus sp.]
MDIKLQLGFSWFPSSSLGTHFLQAHACRVYGSWSFQDRIPKQDISSLYTSVRGPSFRHGLP